MDILMQFLGSAVIAGLVTGAVNSGINDKRIRADIVSKSRIDWIQSVRRTSAEYITELHKLITLGKKVIYHKSILREYDVIEDEEYVEVPTGFDEDGNIVEAEKILIQRSKYDNLSVSKKKEVDELIENLNEITNYYNTQISTVIEKTIHLRMFFSSKKLINKNNYEQSGDNENNEEEMYEDNLTHIKIKHKMANIKNMINKIINDSNNQKSPYDKVYKEIIEFSEYLSDYLKEEWDRAKNNDI
ncbi:hypothetical protein RW115_01275 [Macrococcus capreoli]